MNSIQINNILKSNRKSSRCFKGVFASNNIEVKDDEKFPIAIVANTDKMGEKGTHWVAFFIKNKNNIEYFDSFAEKPNNDIEKFLGKFENVKVNSKKIQSYFDISCGPYVIYFIVERCKGVTFESIIRKLYNKNPYADSFVKLFVHNLIVEG
jgi:hypothetical protein